MKYLTKTISLIFMLLLSMTSCTHNDGDIGHLFGLWKVTSIDINGTKDDKYSGNIFFAFQNGVFSMQLVYPETSGYDLRIAAWQWSGDNLLIDFPKPDEPDKPEQRYEPLITGMSKGENIMVVKQLTSSSMELEHTSTEDGNIYHYSLKKW